MSDGIVDIAEKVKVMHEQYPTVEFLVNLNPSECVDLNWGTPKFTYAEYLDAQTTYINSIGCLATVILSATIRRQNIRII